MGRGVGTGCFELQQLRHLREARTRRWLANPNPETLTGTREVWRVLLGMRLVLSVLLLGTWTAQCPQIRVRGDGEGGACECSRRKDRRGASYQLPPYMSLLFSVRVYHCPAHKCMTCTPSTSNVSHKSKPAVMPFPFPRPPPPPLPIPSIPAVARGEFEEVSSKPAGACRAREMQKKGYTMTESG